MSERPKTPMEQANEILLKDNPAERLKGTQEQYPSIDFLIETAIDIARRAERKR